MALPKRLLQIFRNGSGFLPQLPPGDVHGPPTLGDEDAVALAIARIEAHYFVNRIFLPDNALLACIDRIRHLRCTIVQGRYDLVCPTFSADELHRAWPEAEYIVVGDAGHSAREPGIARELVAATDRFRGRLAGAG